MKAVAKEPLELLKELLEITLKMHVAVCSGNLEDLPEYLSSRQKLIDTLGPLLEEKKLEGTERLQALALLGEITHRDEEIRSRLEELLRQGISSLREGYEVLQAVKVFRDNIKPSSLPRFIEKEG